MAQSCLTLCSPMDDSLLGSSVHGISQARILAYIAISFSRGSSQTRDWTRVSCIGRKVFYLWATREAHLRILLTSEMEKEMATHSSTLAWKILWTEQPGRLQSMGSQRLRHDWATSLSLVKIDELLTYTIWFISRELSWVKKANTKGVHTIWFHLYSVVF